MKVDINEAVALIALAGIAGAAMYYLGDGSKEVVLSIGAGIVGYLSKGVKEALTK